MHPEWKVGCQTDIAALLSGLQEGVSPGQMSVLVFVQCYLEDMAP